MLEVPKVTTSVVTMTSYPGHSVFNSILRFVKSLEELWYWLLNIFIMMLTSVQITDGDLIEPSMKVLCHCLLAEAL